MKAIKYRLLADQRQFDSLLIELDRFTSNSNPFECWEWNGARWISGHGYIKLGNNLVEVHELMYLLCNGSIRIGRHVSQRCRNRHCVNPSHLYLTNQPENVERIHDTDGTSLQNKVLSVRDADSIKRMLLRGMSYKEIGEIFGVSLATISRINKGEIYGKQQLTYSPSEAVKITGLGSVYKLKTFVEVGGYGHIKCDCGRMKFTNAQLSEICKQTKIDNRR